MKIERVHNNIRYTLSNDDIQIDDEVYPIAWGRALEEGGWILHEIDFSTHTSGFPDDPHIVLNNVYSSAVPYQIQTDKGYGPIHSYYKIIKKEKYVTKKQGMFNRHSWVEI